MKPTSSVPEIIASTTHPIESHREFNTPPRLEGAAGKKKYYILLYKRMPISNFIASPAVAVLTLMETLNS